MLLNHLQRVPSLQYQLLVFVFTLGGLLPRSEGIKFFFVRPFVQFQNILSNIICDSIRSFAVTGINASGSLEQCFSGSPQAMALDESP